MINSIIGFSPYEGNEPYIFVSYAHADDSQVLPLISEMNERGFNVWYDDGIEVGSEWQECIATHLERASVVISFISDAYVASANCRRELSFALAKGIDVINVFLEKSTLTPGLQLQVNNVFALFKYEMSEDKFADKFFDAPLMQKLKMKSCSGTGEGETQKAEEHLNTVKTKHKALKIVIGSVSAAVLIACGVCGYIFGTAIPAARRNRVIFEDEAILIAEEYLSDYLGTDASKFVLDDVDRFLNSSAGLKNTVYTYEVDFQSEDCEYDISVNASTGFTRLIEIKTLK